MKALLLVAHGSRRESSNQEVRDLAARLGSAPRAASRTSTAPSWRLPRPSSPTASSGASTPVPIRSSSAYFLSAGRHVVEDIPMTWRSSKPSIPASTFASRLSGLGRRRDRPAARVRVLTGSDAHRLLQHQRHPRAAAPARRRARAARSGRRRSAGDQGPRRRLPVDRFGSSAITPPGSARGALRLSRCCPKQAPVEVVRGLPGDGDDAQRRLLTVRFDTPAGPVTVLERLFPAG